MNRNIVKHIPNMLSFLRIILIIPIVILYNSDGGHLAAVILLAVSCLTDLIDGKIARKFNAVSKLGKGLDGFADKLMQLAMILCLLSKYSQLNVLFAVLLVKEIGMGVIGLVYYKKTKEVHAARMYGKVSTVLIDSTLIILFFFNNLPNLLVWGMICACLISSFFAGVMYALMYTKSFKEIENK